MCVLDTVVHAIRLSIAGNSFDNCLIAELIQNSIQFSVQSVALCSANCRHTYVAFKALLTAQNGKLNV